MKLLSRPAERYPLSDLEGVGSDRGGRLHLQLFHFVFMNRSHLDSNDLPTIPTAERPQNVAELTNLITPPNP
jgi:hypothetical protein